MIAPGQVYDRVGNVVVVLRKLNSIPRDWIFIKGTDLSKFVFWEVIWLYSDFEPSRVGHVGAWESSYFDAEHVERLA